MPLAILATVSPTESQACGSKASAACLEVFRWTHNDVLARAADWPALDNHKEHAE